MAITTWTPIRKQLAANARAVMINGSPLEATHVPTVKVVSPPLVSVQNIRGDFDGAFGRGVDVGWDVYVRVFAGTTDSLARASDLLDLICAPDGPTSLRAALIPPAAGQTLADRTLGGLVQACRVVSMDRDVIYTVGTQANWLGAEFVVRVW